MSNNNMTAAKNLETIRNYATEMLCLIDSKPLEQPMPWMIQCTAEEHAATIAGHCAKMAVEIVKLVTDRPITIEPN